jgi:hypothetical protein
VEDAAGLKQVAGLLKAPPLRQVPDELVELRPPYPSGDNLFLSLQFARHAGVVYIAGQERYAVLDMETGETVVTGAGQPGGRISENGRVLAIPVEGGVELRETESGAPLVTLTGATGDEFDWVGSAGIVHIAPPVHAHANPRLVYRDLENGLETSLATVDQREPRYIFDFGVISVAGHEDTFLLARDRFYRLMLTQGEEGVVAKLGDSISTRAFNPARASLVLGNSIVAIENEAVTSLDLATFEISRNEVPGLFLDGRVRTVSPEQLLVRIYFKNDAGELIKSEGKAVGRNFYYVAQRSRLAPAQVDVPPSRLTYVDSVRRH